jgi:DNA-binding response OmpR family regulator
VRKRQKAEKKAEKKRQNDGPPRVLVVDDNVDAARLLGKLFRRAGYEAGESSDPQLTINALAEQPVAAVVASYSTTGTGASLRLLDMIRNHGDSRVNNVRFLLISDHPRKRIFCYQAGADAILLRPFESADLLGQVAAMIERTEAERVPYRRQQVRLLKASNDGPLDAGSVRSPVSY